MSGKKKQKKKKSTMGILNSSSWHGSNKERQLKLPEWATNAESDGTGARCFSQSMNGEALLLGFIYSKGSTLFS